MTYFQLTRAWIAAQGQRITGSERGASLIEYALLVALIALVCIAGVTFMGEETGSRYQSVGESLSVAGPESS